MISHLSNSLGILLEVYGCARTVTAQRSLSYRCSRIIKRFRALVNWHRILQLLSRWNKKIAGLQLSWCQTFRSKVSVGIRSGSTFAWQTKLVFLSHIGYIFERSCLLAISAIFNYLLRIIISHQNFLIVLTFPNRCWNLFLYDVHPWWTLRLDFIKVWDSFLLLLSIYLLLLRSKILRLGLFRQMVWWLKLGHDQWHQFVVKFDFMRQLSDILVIFLLLCPLASFDEARLPGDVIVVHFDSISDSINLILGTLSRID